MSATHDHDPTPTDSITLYLAFELGWTSWNLAFTTGMAQKPRLRTIPARDLDGLRREIQRAKRRFSLPDTTPILSCYEAGRDGFWLHRYLGKGGVHNLVVDAASIEVNRRARRAKSDRLDVAKLLTMLIGQVPPPPDQLKDDTVASATRSRSVIKWTCSIFTPCSTEHVLPVTPRTSSS
jgi:hypothetical protein